MTTKETRFTIIEELREKHPLPWLIHLADVSRSGYYKWRKTRERTDTRQKEEPCLKEHIMAIHRVRPYYGYLRMTTEL